MIPLCRCQGYPCQQVPDEVPGKVWFIWRLMTNKNIESRFLSSKRGSLGLPFVARTGGGAHWQASGLHPCGSAGLSPKGQCWSPFALAHSKVDAACWQKPAIRAAVKMKRVLSGLFGLWDEFSEAMENNFWTASRKFWPIIRRLRRGKHCAINTV